MFRAWFYFRIGYATYLSFLLSFASNIVLIYALALKGIPSVDAIFSHLYIFAIVALAIIVPSSIGVGLYHMKRTGAFAADAMVSMESNPYIYRVVPGKEQEVVIPLMIATAKGMIRMLERQNTLSDTEKKEFQELLGKANKLLEGQPIGTPKGLVH